MQKIAVMIEKTLFDQSYLLRIVEI